jgi:hypothetical protein
MRTSLLVISLAAALVGCTPGICSRSSDCATGQICTPGGVCAVPADAGVDSGSAEPGVIEKPPASTAAGELPASAGGSGDADGDLDGRR